MCVYLVRKNTALHFDVYSAGVRGDISSTGRTDLSNNVVYKVSCNRKQIKAIILETVLKQSDQSGPHSESETFGFHEPHISSFLVWCI